MPKFRYEDTVSRYYPARGLRVAPGETVTAEENPDPHRFAEVRAPKASKKESDPA